MPDSTKVRIDPNMPEDEKTCIRLLAKLFAEGKRSGLSREALKMHGLDLDYPTFDRLMSMMQHYGVVDTASHALAEGGRYHHFSVGPVAVQLRRELDRIAEEADEPRDIVDDINKRARRNPVWASLIIAFAVVTIFIAFVNQLIELLKKIM